GEEQRWFFPDHATTWHARIGTPGKPARAQVVRPDAWSLEGTRIELPAGIPPDGFHTVTVTNLGLDGEWRGRILLYDVAVHGTIARALHFLDSLTTHVTPSLTNVVLMRRLRSQAGAAERARVARELHDGTIQSLLGIEMTLEALRRTTRPEREVA